MHCQQSDSWATTVTRDRPGQQLQTRWSGTVHPIGFLVQSPLGHCRISLTCAYSFPSSVHNDNSAGRTSIRVQVPLSDTTLCAYCEAVRPRLTPLMRAVSLPNRRPPSIAYPLSPDDGPNAQAPGARYPRFAAGTVQIAQVNENLWVLRLMTRPFAQRDALLRGSDDIARLPDA
jgi:hypothetical protein